MDHETQRHSTWFAARDADITVAELWLKYYSVGGNHPEFDIDSYLHGLAPLPVTERDLLAMALNELIDDLPRRPRAARSFDAPEEQRPATAA